MDNAPKMQEEDEGGALAPWKEGKLFPEGWENMSLAQKVRPLYSTGGAMGGFVFVVERDHASPSSPVVCENVFAWTTPPRGPGEHDAHTNDELTPS